MDQNYNYAFYAIAALEVTTFLIGFAIVFVWKRNDVKPTFIKVIWVLLCFTELGTIICWSLFVRHNNLYNGGEEEKANELWSYLVVMWTVVLVSFSITHWIFATYYLEVVLLLPLIMNHMQPDL